MNTMTGVHECLLYLMACALQNVPAKEEALTGVDLKRLLATAQSHFTASMACMVLEKTDVFARADETTRKQWLEAKNKAIRKNMLLDAERKAILHQLEAEQIWHMPLKGSILKDWYPKPGMREMADNDILFDPAKRERVRDIFLSRGYKAVFFQEGIHDEYEKPPIYHFEMHVSLFSQYYSELFEQYANIKEKLLPVDGTAYQFAFSPEDFYVFVLAHAYKHYSARGTGVRTLADIYVMNRRLGGVMNPSETAQKLARLGIAEYEQRSRALAEKLFSVARPLPEIGLTQDEAAMLQYYCTSSAYGTIDNFFANQLHQFQGASAGVTRWTKIKYCCARLFPGRSFCKEGYPFVYKHPWLLPFFWVWRIVDRVVIHGKRLKKEFAFLKEYQSKKSSET